MSILQWLRDKLGEGEAQNAGGSGDSDAIRRIARELDDMDADRARYLAAFAYVLGRVAHADRDISDSEVAVMERLVCELGGLPEQQATLIVTIAKAQNELFGGTENYLVTRELREVATRAQCEQLLHCLFAVAVADDSISGVEEGQLRRISAELGFTDAEFIAVRRAYNDKREVVQALRRRRSQ